MRGPSSLKQEFLKKWAMGLKICSSSKKDMTIFERKKAIKLSADLAMASTRIGTACWSRALIANASNDGDNKIIVSHILGSDEFERLKRASKASVMCCNKRVRSKKILKRSCSVSRSNKVAQKMVVATSIAKRLVKKQTQVLRGLIPGGESMEESSLIGETLDYMISLRAQVDVMRRVANAT
ncbi:transcription factor IBH1-like 1 isoform X2 [Cornus florida]|nr:transcription factor IBH1-like 1 isoform X2 [Cornus florida]